MEGQTFLGSELLRMRCQIIGKLFLARLDCGDVLGEEFHLLPDAAANDDIVAVQSGRSSFAIENLFADVIIDQALQFLLAWRTPPRPGEPIYQGGYARRGNNDLGEGLWLVLLAK